jgi:hypothetical protein
VDSGTFEFSQFGAEQQRRLSNVKLQKLKQLEVYNKGILALTTWLDDPDSRNMFKGKVYGPILCEVTVDKAMNASYLEQHCPSELLSFTPVDYGHLPFSSCHSLNSHPDADDRQHISHMSVFKLDERAAPGVLRLSLLRPQDYMAPQICAVRRCGCSTELRGVTNQFPTLIPVRGRVLIVGTA